MSLILGRPLGLGLLIPFCHCVARPISGPKFFVMMSSLAECERTSSEIRHVYRRRTVVCETRDSIVPWAEQFPGFVREPHPETANRSLRPHSRSDDFLGLSCWVWYGLVTYISCYWRLASSPSMHFRTRSWWLRFERAAWVSAELQAALPPNPTTNDTCGGTYAIRLGTDLPMPISPGGLQHASRAGLGTTLLLVQNTSDRPRDRATRRPNVVLLDRATRENGGLWCG